MESTITLLKHFIEGAKNIFSGRDLDHPIGTAILMSYYFFFSSNYGGWSYSIRWYKPVLRSLVICSIIIAGIGLINPWSNQDLHIIPLLANLKQLLGFLS